MVIDDYIMSKRFIKKEPPLSQFYLNWYNIFLSIIDWDKLHREPPKLVTCYSTERTCEFVSMNEEDYIIYDEYLGQTFNKLNRIFLNSTDKFDIITYAYKIMAEIYHFSSKIELSQLCLVAYAENNEMHQTYKREKDLGIRGKYTFIQESFVLMHEVVHWHLSNKDIISTISKKRSQLMDHLLDMQRIDDPDQVKAFLDDIDAVFDSPYGSYKEYITPKRYKEYEISFKAKKNIFFEYMMELVKTSDDFIEECLCDNIATEFLVNIMTAMFGIDIEECLQIIYVGLENLGILTILRNETLKEKKDDNIPVYIVESLLRKSQFRNTAPFLFDNYNPEYIKRCNERFVASNRRFTKIIKDPVLFLLTDILNELKQLDIKEEPPIMVSNEQYNKIIRDL